MLSITVTGTVDEIIAFAESLKAGKYSVQETSNPIGYEDSLYIQLVIEKGVIAAIKQCRHDHTTGELSLLKGARDHVQALLEKAVENGFIARKSVMGGITYYIKNSND